MNQLDLREIMRLAYKALLILLAVGLLMYFLGWLVVRDPELGYMLVGLGFCISVASFGTILALRYEEATKE